MASDLETLIAQVWSPDVRPLAEEAWRCYNAGAIRSCIAATWSAVGADIIGKLVRLADEGDAQAQQFRHKVETAREHGLRPEGVTAMQKIEGALVDEAVKFELIDTIDGRELNRIREDRHLCAHPSLRAAGEAYTPRAEVGRAHLAVALTTLLVHPPTQGKKLIEEFKSYICDPMWAPSALHVQATFHDRTRVATRNSIIKLAAKSAMLELAADGVISPSEHADRMAVALEALAERDRDTVRDAVGHCQEQLQTLDAATQLRVLVRMADHDYFWSAVGQPLADRFQAQLSRPITVVPWEPLPHDVAASLAVVASKQARDRLPALALRFEQLDDHHRRNVMAARAAEYFVPAVIVALQTAGSWRTGEAVGRLLVQHAEYLTVETPQEALCSWHDNNECRQAVEMPGLAVQLFHATAHLGDARFGPFGDFAAKCESTEGRAEYYSYPGLHEVLRRAEGTRRG